MEIDQDYRRTGTAIGSRASHEHLLRFLVFFPFFLICHFSLGVAVSSPNGIWARAAVAVAFCCIVTCACKTHLVAAFHVLWSALHKWQNENQSRLGTS